MLDECSAADPCTFADQVRYPVKQQVQKLRDLTSRGLAGQMPLIVGKLDHGHTEPSDFLEFVHRGARVLLLDSTVILQCLVARSALNKVVDRPFLYWVVGHDERGEFILGEEVEAGLVGADGISYKSGNILNQDPQSLKEKLDLCRQHNLASGVFIEAAEHAGPIAQYLLKTGAKPNFIVTLDDTPPPVLSAEFWDAGTFHLHMYSVNEASQLAQLAIPGNGIVLRDINLLPVIQSDKTVDPIVKVCGIKSVEAAAKALEAGANMIGMILVPNRSRTVDLREAKRISDYVHSFRRRGSIADPIQNEAGSDSVFDVNSRVLRNKTRRNPVVVGVFQNMSLENVLTLQQELNLDVVQLHGEEPLQWCRAIPVPVIKRFTPGTSQFQYAATPGYHYMALIDGEQGGEGRVVDWSATEYLASLGARFLLAGGLHEANVAEALQVRGVAGVDVSGGVETNGVKDLAKITRFVETARATRIKL
jgi:phosphoribosylanthranilate isomerase